MATYNRQTGSWDVYGTGIGGQPQRQISFTGFGLPGSSFGGTSGSGKTLAQLLEEANQANEARYQQGLGLYDQMQDRVGQFGQTALGRIGRNETYQTGAAEQSLISRGLGNSTVVPAVQRGIRSDAEFARQGVNEAQARAANDVTAQRIGFIERRSDVAPNLGLYAQYQQGANSAPYGTWGSSSQSGSGSGSSRTRSDADGGGGMPKDNYYDQFRSPVSASTQAYLDKIRSGQTGSLSKEDAAAKLRALGEAEQARSSKTYSPEQQESMASIQAQIDAMDANAKERLALNPNETFADSWARRYSRLKKQLNAVKNAQ